MKKALLLMALLILPLTTAVARDELNLWGVRMFLPTQANPTFMYDLQQDRALGGVEADFIQYKRVYGNIGFVVEEGSGDVVRGLPFLGVDFLATDFFGLKPVRVGAFVLRDWQRGDTRGGLKASINIWGFIKKK